MIKCDNCASEAEYISDPPFASTAYFCSACIPWSLINEHRAGLLPRVEQPVVEEAVVDALEEAPTEDTEIIADEVVPPVVEAPVAKKKKITEVSSELGDGDVSDN